MASDIRSALTLLSQTCALSIAAITTKSDAQELPLTTLRADFISLLSVLYSNTTKLSIALNPSKPAYSAALLPLKDLVSHSSTLASNASLFLPRVHGRALTAEVHSTAKSVLTALQELAHAHLALLTHPTTPTPTPTTTVDAAAPGPRPKNGNDVYLAKTGVVHELISQAKANPPDGLSVTNLIAVRKRWREHTEIIDDAVAVLGIEADPPDDDDGNGFDDGWHDPELDSDPGEQSPEQIALAKTLLSIVERTSALFHDVRGALLPPLRAPAQTPPNALLDDLLDSAPPLVAAVDNLATQIYGAPDDPSSLHESRDSFARALTSVAIAVKAFWKGKEDTRPASKKGSRAYFVEQFAQLNAAVEALQWTIIT
ncbi:hypothetical protein F5148DRAFT_768271 [Russula earlei]|uniref:Uncharacterized protein n=1 Tax=Russula earlei TaxID=71964 RepID=A0ACC0UCR1_9AGAM|nr:hypothetical protein F5148DRAFT_768271 [Russula earlei]